MNEPRQLKSQAKYRGRIVTVVGRCYVGGEWLYDVRGASGKLLQYVPARKLKDAR